MSEWLGQYRKYSQTVANSVHEELHPHAAVLPPGEVPPEHGVVLLMDVADGGVKGIMEDDQQQHQNKHSGISKDWVGTGQHQGQQLSLHNVGKWRKFQDLIYFDTFNSARLTLE